MDRSTLENRKEECYMIKKAHQLKTREASNLRGGKGVIQFIDFLGEEESCGTGRLFASSTIPVGGSIGYHKHEGDFEIFYFLEGKAKVCDNGIDYILEQGDCAVCYDGESHSIENIGDCDLKYIAIIPYIKK